MSSKAIGASLAALFGLLLMVRQAAACSCVPPPPPKKALKQASAVFVGKVIGVVVDENNHAKRVTMEVERVYKGIETRRVELSSVLYGSMCGFPFEKGKTYLVYAEGKEHLSTGICTRTALLQDAKKDLKVLGRGKPPPKAPDQ